LDEDRMVAQRDHARQIGQVALHLVGENVSLVGLRLQRALGSAQMSPQTEYRAQK
jgi:hypothetical protein